jgi:hypothetical protein
MPSFTVPAIVGGVGALGSVAGAANSIFGGGAASSPQTGQVYIPPNQPQAGNELSNLTSEMYNFGTGLPQQLYPQYQQQAGQLTDNPYAGLAQTGANAAAAATPAVAGMQLGGASSIYGQGASMQPYATAALQAGFDPQQQLYQQQQNQAASQANAINAQNGVGGTPYGASLANNANNNFNINWQNAALGRQQTATQTATGLNQATGLDYSTASTLGTGALGSLVSGYGSPYATSTGQATQGIGGLNDLTNASSAVFGLPQQTVQDLESYLGRGQSASGLALQGQNQAFQQNQILGTSLANSLSNPALGSSLNSLFSSSSPYSSTGGYANADAGGYGYSGGGSYTAY